MTHEPKWIKKEMLAVDASRLMKEDLITILPVAGNGRLVDAIHMHDLIPKGFSP